MDFFARTLPSRKFVDLIHTSSPKWVNWEPANPIEVGPLWLKNVLRDAHLPPRPGDYVVIDRRTGQFEKKGSIYDEAEIADMTSSYPPDNGPCINYLSIISRNAKPVRVMNSVPMDQRGKAQSVSNKGENSSGAPESRARYFPRDNNDAAEILFRGQWKFGRSRGALALLYGCQVKRLPYELPNKPKEADWARGKLIVTETDTCPAYVFYLSDRSNETVTLALCPRSSADGGDGTNVDWVHIGASGSIWHGYNEESAYVPMYQLMEVPRSKA